MAAWTIHLIGVEHRVQWRQPMAPLSQVRQDSWAVYSSILLESIGKFRPTVVAEELNEETLCTKNKAESILLSTKKAYELDRGIVIKHIFAEPCSVQKHKLGIGLELPFSFLSSSERRLHPPDGIPHISDYEWHKHDIAHRFPIREDFWIARLRDDIRKTAIFVCGALHVCTFKERLERIGITVEVIADSVGCLPTLRESDAYKALQDVRENGFPPVLTGVDSNCFCTMQQDDTSVASSDLE